MEIIKEYWEHDGSYHALIRTNTYCKTLAHVQKILAEIKKDYKDINPEYIDVVVYGGDRIKGIMGLEFPIKKPALNYKEIHRPEYLLN